MLGWCDTAQCKAEMNYFHITAEPKVCYSSYTNDYNFEFINEQHIMLFNFF